TLAFDTRMNANDDMVTYVNAEGHVNIQTLPHVNLALLDYVSGETAYSAELEVIHAQDKLSQLSVTSDLTGLEIDLPEPLGKSAQQDLAFTLHTDFAQGQDLFIQLAYDDIISANLAFANVYSDYYLQRGEIRFGSRQALLPNQPEFFVIGNTPYLSLTQWIPYLQLGTQLETGSLFNLLDYADVQIEQADLVGQVFEDLQVKFSPQEGNWVIDLNNERFDAIIEIPNDLEQAIKARFSDLYLVKNESEANERKEQDWSNFHPKYIPPLDIDINHLYYGENLIGELIMKSSPSEDGLIFQELTLHSENFSVTTSGRWLNIDGEAQTMLQGQIIVEDVADILGAWDMASDITSRKGEISFDLAWPSTPYDFSYETIDGEITFDFRRGRIRNLSEETQDKLGIGKLLNILNLQTLPRRLTLDFSDLTKKGYSYDVFAGHLNLRSGDVEVVGAYFNGPVAYLRINGDIDLVNNYVDLIVSVSPRLTASLPIIATIVGGPVVGAATWVAEKVVTMGLRAKSMLAYEVKGSWDDMQIERISPSQIN
ncbi:MAG: AsmA-like C-terminal region-containing protein, partial [Gammaproteobacteria bacterium]